MRKTTIEKIEKEIDEKTKLPKEIKDKIRKEVFINIIIASAIILYFIFIVLGSIGTVKSNRSIDLNIFSIIFLGITIILFEIAYRKDNGKLAMHGIEFLSVAIFTLFLPYIIFELNETNKKHYLVASIYIAIYYILKSIIIAIKTKNKYMNSNISDVKEIVKKEKTNRRIKEGLKESERTKSTKNKATKKTQDVKQIKKEETTPKKSKTKKTETKNNKTKIIEQTTANKKEKAKKEEIKNIEGETKKEGIPKKRGRPRKIELKIDETKTTIEQTAPKKRGRPKKIDIEEKENKTNESVAPKKRGRPRKVVNEQ